MGTPENLVKQLTEQSGDSTEWPSDEKFGEAWRTQHAYQVLNNSKIVHILKRLSNTYLTGKMEAISISGEWTVEHVLPQQWHAKWPRADGSAGLATEALWTASNSSESPAFFTVFATDSISALT